MEITATLRMVSTNGVMRLPPLDRAGAISTVSSLELYCCAVRAAGEETILHPRRLREHVRQQPTDPHEHDHCRQSRHGATAVSICGALSHADVSSCGRHRQLAPTLPMIAVTIITRADRRRSEVQHHESENLVPGPNFRLSPALMTLTLVVMLNGADPANRPHVVQANVFVLAVKL